MRWSQPYFSRRSPVIARNIVATSQPLAAQAGLQALAKGGNAIDAALAAAMTLTVVEPTGCGIGGDLFAIVWDGSKIHGLNASGRSPKAWTPAFFARSGEIPSLGWNSVTVPGIVSGWVALSKKFGRLSLDQVSKSARLYAKEGFPVSPQIAHHWEEGANRLRDQPGFKKTFLPKNKAPRPGEIFCNPHQADTLAEIAETHGKSFYAGPLADRIIAFSRAFGGAMTHQDLARHEPDWTELVSLNFGPYTIHEMPPNGQGIAALIALGILEEGGFISQSPERIDGLHAQIEAMKLAFEDLYQHVADPECMTLDPQSLIDRDALKGKAQKIDPSFVRIPQKRPRDDGGTVYVTTADDRGNMVSLIQSNYRGFGSGVVIPDTGIAMQNRGLGFTMEKGHPNEVGPAKRPFHTIIPGFVTKGDQAQMSFGIMGGDVQAQAHLQFLLRVLCFGQNPQTALDAPRWRILEQNNIAVEKGYSSYKINKLRKMGHDVVYQKMSKFGGGQAIWRQSNGIYIAGSDPRKDGHAIGL